MEIAQILNVNIASIKKYDYKNVEDIIYTLMWLEELLPNYHIDLSDVLSVKNNTILELKKFLDEWNIMRNKRMKREISYNDYIDWKLNYKIKEDN